MAALTEKEVTSLDLYELLDVPPDADEKQIVKAYRKKALKCHPDKNPDDPKAADLFHKISRALEVLTDKAAKEAYDKVLRARKATEVRNRELDAKRRKLKEDLESREASAFQKQEDVVKASRTLAEEIARLRKEGSSLLKQEQERMREELSQQKVTPPEETEGAYRESEPEEVPRLKVKWKAQKDDNTNGGYTEDKLLQIFNKYGRVVALIVSAKRKGSAVIEFESPNAALRAVKSEEGLTSNPLTLSWLSGHPTYTGVSQSDATPAPAPTFPAFSFNTQTARPPPPPSSGERDFESLVLMRMRQAEERKRLAAQLAAEDDVGEEKTSRKTDS